MNIILENYDLFDHTITFIELDESLVLFNVSKYFREIIAYYLRKKYKLTLKNIDKKRCLECLYLDNYSVKTKFCRYCYDKNICEDCLKPNRHGLYYVPASCYLIGSYETSFYKYVCKECIFECNECKYTSVYDNEFIRKDSKIYCKKCKNSNQSARYWYDVSPEECRIYYPEIKPFEDYEELYDDEVFMFSFYLYGLFN